MEIEHQFIGRDDRGNLLLLVETHTSKFFILNYTNELGFDEITKEVFIASFKNTLPSFADFSQGMN